MNKFLSSCCILIILIILFPLASCNLIFKPTKQTGIETAYVFVQGAEIPAINYQKYALKLQEKFDGSLWVGITEFPFDLPQPVSVKTVLNSLFQAFKSEGLNYNKNTNFFFGGHSLGGIVIQNYLFGLNKTQLPFKYAGLILEGSFVTRSNTINAQNFAPILTIGAELDGLARITRIAESYYRNINSQSQSNYLILNSSSTVVIKGMNHFQFAGEGKPPPTVVKNDIMPEINDTLARENVTCLINLFFNFQLNQYTKNDVEYYANSLKQTAGLVAPIIEAFEMEGFYHFKPPCNSVPNLKPPECFLGSPFSKIAQQIMSNISESVLNETDSFINVFSVPEKFPSLQAINCPGPACSIIVNSHTENSYSMLDFVDNGLDPVAAIEAKTKMQSRQSIQQALTNKTFDFNKTDAINVCGQINQASIDWALKKAPPTTLNRYLNKGKYLVVVDDIGPLNNGFLWITNSLSFKENLDPKTNRTYIELGSPTLRTPTDYSIKFVAGYHYCKVLSPARAIEWMYVDCVKP